MGRQVRGSAHSTHIAREAPSAKYDHSQWSRGLLELRLYSGATRPVHAPAAGRRDGTTSLKKQDQRESLQSSNDEGNPSSAARCSDRDDDSSSVIFQMKRLSLSDFHKARLPNSSHRALAVA